MHVWGWWRAGAQTEGHPSSAAVVDSARANLASSFVNGFLNAGFGNDKLMTVSTEVSASSARFPAGVQAGASRWQRGGCSAHKRREGQGACGGECTGEGQGAVTSRPGWLASLCGCSSG